MILAKEIQAWLRFIVFIILLINATCPRAELEIPSLKSHVTDLAAALSMQEIEHLEYKLAAFEKTKGSQIAVLIVPTTHPESIEQYSIRVAEAWKLGREKIDDGMLLLIAKNDRALRIDVGYGLEGVLPDAKTKRIIEEIIIPRFKAGNFAKGINAGIDAILSLIEGEPLPPKTKRDIGYSINYNVFDNFFLIFIGLMVFGRILQSLLGRFVGSTVMGIGAGFLGWLLFTSLSVALFIAIIIFLMGLFQNTARGIYRNGRSSWSNGGYWSGGIRGGSSGGGFGGGGGGFGGGGASGRW